MDLDKYGWLIPVSVILAVIGFCIYMAANHSFGVRCKDAGYVGAELEMCVKRASNGGPVYKENVDKWHD